MPTNDEIDNWQRLTNRKWHHVEKDEVLEIKERQDTFTRDTYYVVVLTDIDGTSETYLDYPNENYDPVLTDREARFPTEGKARKIARNHAVAHNDK
jgi:hypothetical protein